MGGLSIWHWLIVLLIVVLVFGTKKLKNIGQDLGGAVALIVLGPERLPRVARTVGHLLGKAQRYVADVKAEVNRSIELEELKKMKSQFQEAAQDVHDTVRKEINDTRDALQGGDASAYGDAAGVAVMQSSYGPTTHWPK